MTTRPFGPKGNIVGVVLLLGGACAPESDVDTAQVSSSVHGPISTSGCNPDAADALVAIMEEARIVARSPAFAECVADVFTQPLAFSNNTCGGAAVTVGPYFPCGMGPDCSAWCSGAGSDPGGCYCDPLATASDDRQLARILSAARSRNPVVLQCEVNPLPVGECTSGWSAGGTDTVHWNGLPTNTLWATGFAMHELLHTAAYSHDNCGYWFNYNGYNSVSGLAGSCGIRIARRSESVCDFDSPLCGPNERRVVRHWDSTSSADCHCVGAADEYDTNNSDRFGAALAVGDFDNDGFDDLAVGAPGEDNRAGAVFLFRGSETGLHGWKRIRQSDIQVTDDYFGNYGLGSEAGDEFGASLTVGDFDNDGFDDLVIGSPGEKLSSESACSGGKCGYVVILPGSSEGPSLNGQGLSQRGLGANETGDKFGYALAAGDLDGDQLDDLVVGVPEEVYYGKRSGVAMVFSGSTSTLGLYVEPTVLLRQTSPYKNETGDRFGTAIAIGNLRGNTTTQEIAIGAPGENNGQGYVFVAEYGQGSWSVTYGVNNFDDNGFTNFGASLAAGDVVSNGYDDLIVGAPAENQFAGAVLIFKGSTNGPISPKQHLHNGDNAPVDLFGFAVAVGNFESPGGKDDVVVGIPNEAIGTSVEGALWRYRGTTAAAQSMGWSGQQHFYSVSATDRFLPEQRRRAQLGLAVAVGRFNGSEFQIAAGAPTDQPDGQIQAGSVYVFDGDGNDIQRLDQVAIRYGDHWFSSIAP